MHNTLHSLSHLNRTDSDMGKGDKRTKKGKIYRGTYGKRRPRKLAKKKAAPAKRA